MIEQELRTLLLEALSSAERAGDLPQVAAPAFDLTQPPRREHGDWATNLALVVQKDVGRPPRQIAELVVKHLPDRPWVRDVQVAGPGFINLFLSQQWLHDVCGRILSDGPRFGSGDEGSGSAVNVEFVSINPTGPLHVGSARNAAIGDAVARLLEFRGHTVTREYYFNDAGSQMTKFGRSVAARYLQALGRDAEVPEDGYHGSYVADLARQLVDAHGDRYADDDVETLGETMRELAYPVVIAWIETSLERFRVHFDVWFKERDLYASGKVDEVLDRLSELGYVYEHEGAKWLRTTDFGDARDRPVVRSFGDKEPTYLLPDLAYHLDKAARGFDRMIVVLGADHHGHAPSLRAGMEALGVAPDRIEALIYQWVHVLRAGEQLPMSKRAGTFVTLDELIDEVGVDAARYGLLSTSSENTLYFDIEEVKRQSLENPVYYVQYAHARIASIVRNAEEHGLAVTADVPWAELVEEAELELMRALSEFPDIVRLAASQRAPHRIAKYAEELARRFHRFYTDCRVITDDVAVTSARLALALATKQVVANALGLLGVSAPERMDRDEAIEESR